MKQRELLNLRALLTFVGLFMVAVCAGQSLIRDKARPLTAPGNETLDAFDRAVQGRFHNVIGFGMSRVSTQRWFLPETEEEKEAVTALKHEGYEVCIYLVGRNILQDIPADRRRSNPNLGSSGEHLMSGPVFVGAGKLTGLPAGNEMWEPAREALRKFDAGAAQQSFGISGWQIEARPVRASDDKCLSCHGYDARLVANANGTGRRWIIEKQRNQLQLGDPVGVLLYVYRKKS